MIEIIYKTQGRKLPTVLLEDSDYQDLSKMEKQNFFGRLLFLEEICIKSSEWITYQKDYENWYDFIDNLELDLFINIGLYSKEESISNYTVHGSWTFDTTPEDMFASLPDCAREPFSKSPIGYDCDEKEFSEWLESGTSCLSKILDTFYEAESLDCAIGCLIAADICLADLLSGVSKQRFNLKFPRYS